MKINVVKIGGNVVESPTLLETFVKDFVGIEGPKVLVHGGGVMASRIQKRLGIEPNMIAGRRVTDEQTLRIVTMVYAGWCSKSVVAVLQKYGCNSIGLCGADANVIRAVKRPPVKSLDAEGNEVVTDYGFVGDVTPEGVDGTFLRGLLSENITPVICAITHDGAGNLLNTNADTIASNVASALCACYEEVALTFCFEKNGVLYDKDDEDSVIPHITPHEYEILKKDNKVAEGMIPKLDNAFRALESGVSKVTIKHAKNILSGKGTLLTLE